MCLHCLGSQRLPRHINNHSCIDVLIKVLLLQTCATYRCDCPNHKTVNASWPGYPALPVGSFVDAYGVRMVGQFLVTRPEDGEPDPPDMLTLQHEGQECRSDDAPHSSACRDHSLCRGIGYV